MILDEQQSLIRDSVRDFARDQLLPNAAAWDRDKTFPRTALRGLFIIVSSLQCMLRAISCCRSFWQALTP